MIPEVDKLIHEPARLHILLYLVSVEHADFTYLKEQTGLTQGNLSSHLSKLEQAAYIRVEKSFRRRRPLTLVMISEKGREAFKAYVEEMHHLLGDLKGLITW